MYRRNISELVLPTQLLKLRRKRSQGFLSVSEQQGCRMVKRKQEWLWRGWRLQNRIIWTRPGKGSREGRKKKAIFLLAPSKSKLSHEEPWKFFTRRSFRSNEDVGMQVSAFTFRLCVFHSSPLYIKGLKDVHGRIYTTAVRISRFTPFIHVTWRIFPIWTSWTLVQADTQQTGLT